MIDPADRAPGRATAFLFALLCATHVHAQSAPATPPASPVIKPATPGVPSAPAAAPAAVAVPDASLGHLAWLAGCWRGSVNQREFREHWMPLRGELMVGAGHTVNAGRTQDFEYLRLERRVNDVYYVASPSAQKPAVFRLASVVTEGPDTIFTFRNVAVEFPEMITYRRGSGGWLYVQVEGKLGTEDRKVIYPFRRVDCEDDTFIER